MLAKKLSMTILGLISGVLAFGGVEQAAQSRSAPSIVGDAAIGTDATCFFTSVPGNSKTFNGCSSIKRYYAPLTVEPSPASLSLIVVSAYGSAASKVTCRAVSQSFGNGTTLAVTPTLSTVGAGFVDQTLSLGALPLAYPGVVTAECDMAPGTAINAYLWQ